MNNDINMEKKVQEVKETHLTFMNSFVCLLFLLPMFLIFIYEFARGNTNVYLLVFFIGLFLFPILYFYSVRNILLNFKVRKRGEVIRAKVIGYCDDKYVNNGKPTKIIMLSINKENEDKIIYYQTNSVNEEYEINDELELYVYKDYYLIKNEIKNRKETISGLIALMIAIFIIFTFLVSSILNIFFPDIVYNSQRSNFESLEYKIPDDFKLTSSDLYINEYIYTSKDKNHYCSISISMPQYERYKLDPNTCQYIDTDKSLKTDEKKIINGSTWCYTSYDRDDSTYEEYYRKNALHYYSITLNAYYDRDEKCVTSFFEFINSLKDKY